MAHPGRAIEPIDGPDSLGGSRLNGQLIAVGGALASQISEKAKGGEEDAAAEGQPHRCPRRSPGLDLSGGGAPPA